MKRTVLLLLTLAFGLTANAQQRMFKPFKVDVSYGLSVPRASKAGILLSVEPKYALYDQFSLGLRIEEVNAYRNLSGSSTTDAQYIRSYGLTGDYYVSKAKRRVFAGLVAGLYQYATAVVRLDDFKRLTPATFGPAQVGFSPRFGVELSHFRVAAEYNVTFGQQAVNTTYFSLKAGLLIGGGYSRVQ